METNGKESTIEILGSVIGFLLTPTEMGDGELGQDLQFTNNVWNDMINKDSATVMEIMKNA